MIEMIYYFIAAYLILVPLLLAFLHLWLKLRSETTQKWKSRTSRLNLLVALLPLLPYAIVETQTAFLSRSVEPAVKAALLNDGDSTDLKSLKVLRIEPGGVDVYAVVPCIGEGHKPAGYIGVDCNLKRGSHRWLIVGDQDIGVNGIWSDCGSADGNVFPPYPAQFDYK